MCWKLYPRWTQKVAQLSQRDRAAGWVSYVMLWQTDRQTTFSWLNRPAFNAAWYKVALLRLLLIFQQCMNIFAWNSTQLLNKKIYTLLQSLVEIYRKVTKLCYAVVTSYPCIFLQHYRNLIWISCNKMENTSDKNYNVIILSKTTNHSLSAVQYTRCAEKQK